jgi:XTP/dITP diphosphohydrolase
VKIEPRKLHGKLEKLREEGVMLKGEKAGMRIRPGIEKRLVFFATGNFHKFNEARMILREYGLASAMLRAKTLEIQNDSLVEIAKKSAIEAFRLCHLPIMVEDAGLFVNALKGFPGPYAAYVYKTISNPGMLKLMDEVDNRKATFRSVIAYNDGTSEPVCFEGNTNGKVAHDERWGSGKAGFGFDPIFIPNGSRKTFAEMAIEEKNKLSHRSKSVRKFAEWYTRSL